MNGTGGGRLRPGVAALLVGAAVAAAFVGCLGRAAFGGWLAGDGSAWSDVPHLLSIYDAWGRHLGDGRVPLWLSEFDAGYPLPAAWMYGLLHPASAAFLAGPEEVVWAWSAALHAGFGAAGMWLLARRLTGGDAVAAAVAAALFAVSDFLLGRTLCGHLNLVMPLAWTPWVLHQTIRCAHGERAAVPLCAATAALGLVAGHVQVWFYLLPLAAALAILEARAAGGGRAPALRLLAAAALAAAATAVQWVPAVELFSVARGLPADAEQLRRVSAPPAVLVSKLLLGAEADPARVGEFAHEYRGVAGPVVLVLAALGVRRGRRLLWLVAAVAGLVLAVGTRTAATAWLNELPPFGWARAPARALVLPLVGLPVLAALGVSDWRASPRPRRLATVAGCAAAAAVAWALAAAPAGWGAGSLAAALAVVAAVAGLLAATTSAPRGALAALLPLVALGAALVSGVPRCVPVEDSLYRFPWGDLLPAEARGHRLHAPPLYTEANLESQGLRTLRSVAPAEPLAYRALVAERTPADAFWLDIGAEVELTERGPAVVPRRAMGGGRLFGSARPERSPEAAAAALDRGDLGLFVAADVPDPGRAGLPPPGSRVERSPGPSGGRIRLRVLTPSPAWLLVSEKHYPGWRARVGEEDVPVHRGNVAFLALEVPAGESDVVLRYAPPWRPYALAATAAGWLAILSGAALAALRRGPAG